MSDTQSRSFNFQNIDTVHFGALGTIRIIQGEEESLLVEGSAEALDHSKVEPEGSHLNIRLYTWYDFLFLPRPATYTLKVKHLNHFSISGSAEMSSEVITGPNLVLEISGSGKVSIDEVDAMVVEVSSSGSGNFDLGGLNAQEVKASLSGSGNYRFSGSADRLVIRISGSGEVEGSLLDVRREEVHISGAAKVTSLVSEDLDVHISGSGEILYRGEPQIRQSISGSGSVRKL